MNREFRNTIKMGEIYPDKHDCIYDYRTDADETMERNYAQSRIADYLMAISDNNDKSAVILRGCIVTYNGDGTVSITEGEVCHLDEDNEYRYIHFPGISNLSIPSAFSTGTISYIRLSYESIYSGETEAHFNGQQYHRKLIDSYVGNNNSALLFSEENYGTILDAFSFDGSVYTTHIGRSEYFNVGLNYVKDKFIILNKGEIGPGVTGDGLSGIEIDRGDGQEKAFVVWNESIKDFQFGLEGKLARRSEPIGSLKFICNAYFSDTNNGSKTLFDIDMPYGYCLADGRAPNDPDSEIFNTENRHVPNISDNRFLMGSTEAGEVGGASSVTLSHSLSTYSKTIAFDFDHKHNIGSHSHTQGDLITLTRPFANDADISGERFGVARTNAGSFTPNYAFFLNTETENSAILKAGTVSRLVRTSGSLQIPYLKCEGYNIFDETWTVTGSDVTGNTGSTSPSCSTTSGLEYNTNVNHNHTTEDHTVSLLPVFLSILVLYKYKN